MTYYPGFNPEEHGGYLPEQIPGKFFDNPFWSEVAKKFWEDDTLKQPFDAMVSTAASRNDGQLLALAELINTDPDFPDLENSGGYTPSIWGSPSNLSVDRHGKVHAVVGHARDVVNFVSDLDTYADEVELNRYVEGKVVTAAHAYRGEEFTEFITDMIKNELEYRDALSD